MIETQKVAKRDHFLVGFDRLSKLRNHLTKTNGIIKMKKCFRIKDTI